MFPIGTSCDGIQETRQSFRGTYLLLIFKCSVFPPMRISIGFRQLNCDYDNDGYTISHNYLLLWIWVAVVLWLFSRFTWNAPGKNKCRLLCTSSPVRGDDHFDSTWISRGSVIDWIGDDSRSKDDFGFNTEINDRKLVRLKSSWIGRLITNRDSWELVHQILSSQWPHFAQFRKPGRV